MISNRPGNNKIKGGGSPLLAMASSYSNFVEPPSFSTSTKSCEILDTLGFVWALEKVSYELISPTCLSSESSSTLKFFDKICLIDLLSFTVRHGVVRFSFWGNQNEAGGVRWVLWITAEDLLMPKKFKRYMWHLFYVGLLYFQSPKIKTYSF